MNTTPDNRRRVVLVEDHNMVRQLMAMMVKEQLDLSLAADCRTVAEGVEACLREKPDLVIIDWMLPDGRGFDVVRSAGPKLPRTKWIFVSSNEQEHMVREAISLGVHGFVLKRSDLSLLREAVQSLLREAEGIGGAELLLPGQFAPPC